LLRAFALVAALQDVQWNIVEVTARRWADLHPI
jgi:hypothetical protein